MRTNDEHALILGLATADIIHSLDQLYEAGVMPKDEYLALRTAIPDQVRTACGDPITRIEEEEYKQYFS